MFISSNLNGKKQVQSTSIKIKKSIGILSKLHYLM